MEQLTIWDTMEVEEIKINPKKCITCDYYIPNGIKGSYHKTNNIIFPCRLAEYDYISNDYKIDTCAAYKPNLNLYDCCKSCKHSNHFCDENNFCMLEEQQNYHCIEEFREYAEREQRFKYYHLASDYYICDLYDPNELRSERIRG